MTDSPRIYAACLASYNNGRLHGAWIDATQDAEDIRAEIAAMLKASPTPGAEEHAIHDYDGFGALASGMGEYPDLDEIALHGRMIEEHGDAWIAYADNIGDGASEEGFADAYQGGWDSVEDYAASYIEDCGEIDPDSLAGRYFDYAAFARDLEIGGDIWTARGNGCVHVFLNQ